MLANVGLFLLATVALSHAAEICYPPCGCFNDEPPFADRDLPESPAEQYLDYFLFTLDNPNADEGIRFNWTNMPTQFDPTKKTIFMSHGWNSGWTRMQGVMDAILKTAQIDVQVVQIEWGYGASGIWYPQCASNAQVAGACAGHVATLFHERFGAPWESMSCVGHSLGAHTCGYMGKATQGQLGRVSGIDPAGPWFTDEDPRVRIDATDSQFTDVMHTNGDTFLGLGLGYGVGDADFYPNLGYEQPPCGGSPLPGCDHNIGVTYYINSITAPECTFTSVKCNSESDAINGLCDSCQGSDDCQRMGYYADTMRGRGTFFLETTASAPYCKN